MNQTITVLLYGKPIGALRASCLPALADPLGRPVSKALGPGWTADGVYALCILIQCLVYIHKGNWQDKQI